jgi:hypothetical protein
MRVVAILAVVVLVLAAVVLIRRLQAGEHPPAPLMARAQEVLTQIRERSS